MNEYFVPGSVPAPNSPGSSATMRAEFSSIATAFDKLPVLAGNHNEFVVINASGTAMIASGYLFSDFVSLDGVQTVTNKTLAWADNTWPGFNSGATKVAGTAAGNVLLLAENSKLPALDGSLLTNLLPAALGVVPIANGGTGASTLPGAQASLGINLKADANNAVLTGAPTCPTPPTGNSSARIANTQFVVDTVTSIGGAIPSNAIPLMNGVATSGVRAFISRDDHIHPVDTSRAAVSAETAAGTSFTPSGGISATNVQAAISELDTEKAPIASPTLTGTPATTTPLTSDNSTRIASTAFVHSLLAQQPPGVEVSDSTPLMNGVAGPGLGVDASRYDHIHPVDTSRAAAGANSNITSLSGLTTPLSVPQGGTGRATSTTAYGLLAAGTTATGVQQTLAAGLTTQILVGGGASALPVWTVATGSGAPVRATSPTLVTPVLGVATGTSFNSITGLSSTSPAMDGTAAVGTGVTVARADHVHPSDTSRAPLATTTTKTSATGSAVLPVGTTAQRDASPVKGYFRYNDDLDIFEGYTEGVGWGQVGGGQMYGTAQRKAIFFNSKTIAENLTVVAGDNGGSFGPITINDGFTVTIEDGAVWSIV